MGVVESPREAVGTAQISHLVTDLPLLPVFRPPFCMFRYWNLSAVVEKVLFLMDVAENQSLAFRTAQICHVVTELLLFPV